MSSNAPFLSQDWDVLNERTIKKKRESKRCWCKVRMHDLPLYSRTICSKKSRDAQMQMITPKGIPLKWEIRWIGHGNSATDLVSVVSLWTVVASVADAVAVGVLLVGVGRLGAVVSLVENSVVVHVRIASVAEAVAVGILLVQVWRVGTVVASVTSLVVAVFFGVELVTKRSS